MTDFVGVSVRLWPLAFLGVMSVFMGCASYSIQSVPTWIDGRSQEFPRERYLVGRGEAHSRELAEQRAYAAIARIFSARVTAQLRDSEVYSQLDRDNQTTSNRHISLDHLTHVSTEKVLEDVQILDAWHQANEGLYFALAGLDRGKAERVLIARIAEYDKTIRINVEDGRNAKNVIAKIRGFKRAVRDLHIRHILNTDLQIVRLTGEGILAPYPTVSIQRELNDFLMNHVRIAIKIDGKQQSPIQQAVREGLSREGFVSLAPEVSDSRDTDSASPLSAMNPALFIIGTTRLDDLRLFDPHFKYARWCSDLQIVEAESQQIIGVVSRSGKEGHITQRAARSRAIQAMQEAVSTEISQSLSGYIYDGQIQLPSSASCPSPK